MSPIKLRQERSDHLCEDVHALYDHAIIPKHWWSFLSRVIRMRHGGKAILENYETFSFEDVSHASAYTFGDGLL